MQYSRWVCTNTKRSRRIAFSDWLAMMCVMHPKIQFALLAAREHWACSQHHFQTPLYKAVLQSLIFQSPSVALLHPRYVTRHLSELNFMPLLTAKCSSLSSSFCKTCHPFRRSRATLRSVSSADLPRTHSTPFWSLLKALNKTDPRIEHYGTPLVTTNQPDVAPFTTTLSSTIMQLITQLSVNVYLTVG